MNPHLTEIAYILDRSGSMASLQKAAIGAFNEFIKSQLDVPGDVRFTLVQFDDAYEVPVAAHAIQNVPELTQATYMPRGSTALLDAIGRTIKETDARIQASPEPDRPGKVIVAIFTDGEENASQHFTVGHVSDLIREFREKNAWEFLFLAANQDAIASAAAMHMDRGSSGNVDYSPSGLHASSKALHRKIRALRMKSSGWMDDQATEDDLKSLEQLLREEAAASGMSTGPASAPTQQPATTKPPRQNPSPSSKKTPPSPTPPPAPATQQTEAQSGSETQNPSGDASGHGGGGESGKGASNRSDTTSDSNPGTDTGGV
jgi:hypothetical protein